MKPLPHAARVALDPLALAPSEPYEVQHEVDPPPLLTWLDAVQLGEVAEVVERGQPLVEATVTAEGVADATAHLPRLAGDVVTEHPRRARGRKQQRDQHLDRRRFARPVGPEQSEQLALSDLERHPAHRLHLERAPTENARARTVCPREPFRLDDGHAIQHSRGVPDGVILARRCRD